eukprot:49562-Karenia_brevis.AAC.1
MVPGEACKKEMFQRIWVKSKTYQHNGRLVEVEWVTRDQKVPAELENKTLNEKLDIYVEGMPPDMD